MRSQRARAGQLALLIGERAGCEYHVFTGDATLLAVIETAAVQGQTGVGQQGAALVGNRAAAGHGQSAHAGYAAPIVAEARRLQRQRVITTQGAVRVVQLIGQGQVEMAFRIQTARPAVIQLPGVELDITLPGDHAIALIVQAVEAQCDVAVSQDLAAAAVVRLTGA
ncbi:hypothetical protein D3C87_1324890 [compost metagenome]